MNAAQRPRPGVLWLALLTVGLITYGSLYPFNFIYPAPPGAWQSLLEVQFADLHLGDVVANVLLFLPLGLLIAWHTGPRPKTLFSALVVGLMIAMGLQLLQVFVPARAASLWDGGWNVLGTLLGTLLPGARLHLEPARAERQSLFASSLIVLWLAAETFPFVPTLDWQEIKHGLKPLLLNPEIHPMNVLGNVTGWAALAYLWRDRTHLPLPLLGPILTLPLVLTIQVLVMNRAPSLSGVIGGGAGLVLGLLPFPYRLRAPAMLVLLLCWLGLSGLTPFHVRTVPGTFHWLPFSGFLDGSLFNGAWVGIEKLFWFGLLLELTLATGLRLRAALVVGVLLLGALEYAQTRITSGHVAEATDPLIFALLALIRRQLVTGEQPKRPTDGTTAQHTAAGTADRRHHPFRP